ncbi:NmrA family NAD(P)-binding protein [Pseudomonas sp. NBRC 100443]|uniref:SDR family oxidoreductase n=1 Tax=Pseudomonas sp. NBRC 100443 TaxID=1113665 RepID=UPI0024A5B4DE|nr:NmrA family NAD(P)-binding protein [Pseudomonas sp. NBRC 100443]GLU37357.1 nucleotide-diphosphate-sugar epimerase [Pseudomonas sp. NBRC 100443]
MEKRSSIVAITGASGLVGLPAIDALLAQGLQLRVLTSSRQSQEKLDSRGVQETLLGDFRSSQDLDRLLAGASTLLHIPPAVAEDEHEIGYKVIAAAQRANLEHLIFVSCFHSLIGELRHHRNKLLVEQALARSGLTYSVLQPAMFMQNLDYIWPKIEAGVFEWPWDPAQRYTMVDTHDLAQAIARVASDSSLRGGTYELCSADSISVTQMAEALGAALGRPLRTGRQDPEEWAAAMRAAGAPNWSIETVKGMCRYHDELGYAGGNAFVLEALLGRPPTDYRQFAARVADARLVTGEVH